ncbi:hypothetical protein JCM5350_007619 [Sporobolomyces pararoseus]
MARGKKQVHKGTATSPDPPSQGSSASSPRTSTSPRHKPTPLPFTLEQAKENGLACRAQVDEVTWEEQVEQVLMDEMYSNSGQAVLSESSCYSHLLDESSQAGIYHNGLVIARLHFDIARALVKHDRTGGTFERAWRATPEEGRYLMIIEGLDTASCNYGFFQDPVRRLCPDLSPAALSRDGGRGMIELVRFIVRSGLNFEGQDYFSLPNEDFERFYAFPKSDEESLPKYRPIRQLQSNLGRIRNYYLASFVYGVLKQMHYFEEKHIRGALLVKSALPIDYPINGDRSFVRGGNAVESRSSIGQALEIADTPFDFESYPKAKLSKQGTDRVLPTPLRLDACICCKRVRDEIGELVRDGKQLNFCAKCMSLDPPHRFAYCSRECQVQDWPTHKSICGKLFQDPTIPQFGVKPPPPLPPLSIDLRWKLNLQTKTFEGKRTLYCFRSRNEDWAKRNPLPEGLIPTDNNTLSILLLELPSSLWEEEPRTLLLRQAIETRSEEDIKAFARRIFPGSLKAFRAREEGVRELAEDWDIEYEKMDDWLKGINSADHHQTQIDNMVNAFGEGKTGLINGLRYMSELEPDLLAAVLEAFCKVDGSKKGPSRQEKE